MTARTPLLVVFAVLSFTMVASVAGWSEDEAARWGAVDMERIMSEWRERQELIRQYQEFTWEQDRQLQEQHKTRMLTDAERQEYGDRSAMAAPTEVRSQRLEELEAVSSQREKRLLELRQKGERTEEEEAELNDLDPLYEQRMRELAALQAEFQASRRAKLEGLLELLQDNLERAVKEVAEESNLMLVLTKDALLYGGVEITDAVLEKLNAETESAPDE